MIFVWIFQELGRNKAVDILEKRYLVTLVVSNPQIKDKEQENIHNEDDPRVRDERVAKSSKRNTHQTMNKEQEKVHQGRLNFVQ